MPPAAGHTARPGLPAGAARGAGDADFPLCIASSSSEMPQIGEAIIFQPPISAWQCGQRHGSRPGRYCSRWREVRRAMSFTAPLTTPSTLATALAHPHLERGQRLGRLHAVIAPPWQALGKDLVSHAPDKRVARHRCPRHPRTGGRTGGIRDPLAIIAGDPSERARRTAHILGPSPREALRPHGDLPWGPVGAHSLAVAWGTRSDPPPGLRRLAPLA